MKLRVSEDKKFLIVVDGSQDEIEQLEFSLTKQVNNFWIIKKKMPNSTWKGEVKFIDRFLRIPIGLWKELISISKKYMFQIEIDGIEHLYDREFKPEELQEFIDDVFKEAEENFYPYDYQIEAVQKLIQFRNCTEEISTSGGKTLIAYLLFKYMFNKGLIKRVLYVVPNLGLISQSEEKFYEYEDKLNLKPNWTSECVFGGTKKKELGNTTIVFGTYQSLNKRDPEYFKNFDLVIIDECHHGAAASIKTIITKCYNSKYNIGLTGTMPEEGSCDSFTIQSYIGPCVYIVHSADIIENKKATLINIVNIELDYLSSEEKKKLYELRSVKSEDKDGGKLLELEKTLARDNRKRFKYICDLIVNTKKNSLVLFGDIKNEYGRKIYNWIRENSDKNVYYVDGGTSAENRDFYKKKIEEEENTIIVASIGTFKEGIDIANLHSIFIVETSKSQFIIRQILGRGMRLLDGKEVVVVIDISDNFIWGTDPYQKINYLMRHANERKLIYKRKKFPVKTFKVKL